MNMLCQAPSSCPGNHGDHQCCSSEAASMDPHLKFARETHSLSCMNNGGKKIKMKAQTPLDKHAKNMWIMPNNLRIS